MRRLDPLIDAVLHRASVRWRWLRLLRGSATLATVTASLVLLLGITMLLDWLTSPMWVTVCFVLLVLGSLFAWLCIAVANAGPMNDPSHLAASLERVHKPLMDRLNTLVFLRPKRDRQTEAYVERIEQQTRQVLRQGEAPLPFSAMGALRHFGVFLATLAATILFYSCFQPFRHVVAASDGTVSTTKPEYSPPVIPPIQQPGELPPEQEAPWGEVRISEPGQDLRVITLDVVPLRIEAAANRPLQQVAWFTGVNGKADVRHELPPSDDPHYAVHTPELDLLDYALEPWDVLSYFAQATTEDGQSYRSDVYFIEVLPFRDQLDRLDEDADGSGYGLLEQLTTMIERQQQIIRRTNRQQRLVNQPETDRKQQNESLAQDEDDLSEAVRHVAAEAASRFDESVIDELDQPLSRAEAALGQAADSLREDELNEAGQHEQAALAELVTTRKQFHDLCERAIDAPGRPTEDSDPSEQTASDNARLAQEKRQLETTQHQIQSAREFVKKKLLEQRNIEKQADPRKKDQFSQLAEKQRELNRSLDDFIEENPQSFCRCGKECSGAQAAMQGAAQAIKSKSNNARQRAGQAAEQLQKLDESLEQQQLLNGLAQAYKLKEMLDQQIEQLEACQKSGASPGQCQQLAGQAKSVTGQLKKIAEQPPTSESFGPSLREALADENQRKLESLADQLSQAADSSRQKDAAGGLQGALQEVSRAFDASRPGMLGQQQAGDCLRAGGSRAIARGVQLLESAARRQAGGRPLSRQNRSRLGREAVANLEAGISEPGGYDERGRQVFDKLRRDLEERVVPVDLQLIRELKEDIQQLRREVTVKDQSPAGEAEIKHIDPSRLPPAYRKSIETYFQKLSEE